MFSHVRMKKKPVFMIIPMIDIIFFLLVFFMMNSLQTIAQKALSVQLPQAQSASAPAQMPLIVTVDKDGHITLDNRPVSLEEASRYLGLRKQAAPWLALATFLCVLSPITLILLAGLSEYTARISENVAGGIGLCVLILLVAAAVGIFLMCGAKAKPFSFLETEPFETEYGVSGMVRQRRQEFEPTANRLNLIGTILCIVSVLPLFAAMCLSRSDLTYIVAVCLLLGFVALACLAFVYAGTRTGAMEKLLEEGDYTRQRKAKSRLVSTVSVCYWLVVTAVFLLYTFGPLGNGQARYSWFIWAIAGVLYAAVLAVLRLIGNNK